MSKITIKEQEEYIKKLIEYGDKLKTDKELVGNILNNHLYNIPHKKLYKFRTCSNKNLETLRENCIWMPSACSFADTFDSCLNIDLKENYPAIESWFNTSFREYIFELLKQQFENRGVAFHYTLKDFNGYIETCTNDDYTINKEKEIEFFKKTATSDQLQHLEEAMEQLSKFRDYIESQDEKFIEGFKGLLEQIRTQFRNSLLTYCMTENYDIHTLWENYANNYTGFCIEYSFDNINEKEYDFENLLYLLPMQYCDFPPVFDIIPVFDAAIREKLYGDYSYRRNPTLITNMFMQLYFKKSDYSYEKEWRFSIDQKQYNKHFFPFVSAIYAGKNIKKHNFSRLKNIAKTLGVPLYRQEFNKFRNGYDYNIFEEKE